MDILQLLAMIPFFMGITSDQAGVVSPKSDDSPAGDTPAEGVEGGKDDDPGKGADTPGEGAGDGPATEPTPAEETGKRINDLMSKWQTEESAHNRTKAQLEEIRTQFEKIAGRGTEGGQDENLPSFMKPGWAPQTFDDLSDALKEAMEYGSKQTLGELEQEKDTSQKVKDEIDDFVGEVKKADKEFDEDDFYEYANEHKFPLNSVSDLKAVYSAYAKQRLLIKETEKTTTDKIKNRAGEPVNKPGGGGQPSGGIPFKDIQKAGSVLDVAMDAFRKN